MCGDNKEHERHAEQVSEKAEEDETRDEFGTDWINCYTFDEWICHCLGDEEYTEKLEKKGGEAAVKKFCMTNATVVECPLLQQKKLYTLEALTSSPPTLLEVSKRLLQLAIRHTRGTALNGSLQDARLFVYW